MEKTKGAAGGRPFVTSLGLRGYGFVLTNTPSWTRKYRTSCRCHFAPE
jgi:hypothetical protein